MNNPVKPFEEERTAARKISRKKKSVTVILALLTWGLHRVYVGKIGTGILWMLTCGCFFVGQILDLYKLWKNEFTDKNGNYVVI